jgi:tetratricopeptide (TPR) repeat protein
VGDYLTKLNILKNELETRSFEQVEGQIADIQKIATDFDPTKPLALVQDVKLSSQLRIGHAKLLAQQGDLDDAMKEFGTAAEEWPGNPQIKDSANTFFATTDVKNQSTDDFDRLVADQNYREIADKAVMFAPAVHGDAKREQELKDAMTKVQNAEMASEKANLLVMNGDADGAWEAIESAVNDWPDDVKLNKLLANLSTRCADFVSAINKAREAQSKKEYGYSLTLFVNAESYYPGSMIAKAGIDDVSKQILSPDADSQIANGKGPSVQQN